MKAFVLLLLAALGVGGYQAYQRFGPPSEPYRAYQRYATAKVQGLHMATQPVVQKFGGPVVDITDISYDLESQERIAEGQVELVVVQVVQIHYRDVLSRGKLRKTRHYVLMEREAGEWEVTDVEIEKLD